MSYFNMSPSPFFIKLLDNQKFRQEFLQRFVTHLNITFQTNRVGAIIDSLKNNIAGEMPRQIARWADQGGISDYNVWEQKVNSFKDFPDLRNHGVRSQLEDYYKLEGVDVTISTQNPEGGYVTVHEVAIPSLYSVSYFKNMPVKFCAVPKAGYVFKEWQGDLTSNNPEIEVSVDKSITLTAVFEKNTAVNSLFINEFMAVNQKDIKDESGANEDWIELYNASESAINIAGLYLTDNLSLPAKWQIPSNQPDLTTIQAKGFLRLWADNDVDVNALHVGFELKGSGEQIGLSRVFNKDVQWIDSLTYKTQTPDISFGRYPDASINWDFFSESSAGKTNKPGINDIEIIDKPAQIKLFPNPTSGLINLDISNFTANKLTIKIFNLYGQLLSCQNLTVDGESIVKQIDLSMYSNGLYFVNVQTDGYSTNYKVLVNSTLAY